MKVTVVARRLEQCWRRVNIKHRLAAILLFSLSSSWPSPPPCHLDPHLLHLRWHVHREHYHLNGLRHLASRTGCDRIRGRLETRQRRFPWSSMKRVQTALRIHSRGLSCPLSLTQGIRRRLILAQSCSEVIFPSLLHKER